MANAMDLGSADKNSSVVYTSMSPSMPDPRILSADDLQYRTFDYAGSLPYKVEDHARREADLDFILEKLYISCHAGDFDSSMIHCTDQLTKWLDLKFDLSMTTRFKLVKIYYDLAMTPGLFDRPFESCADMFSRLAGYSRIKFPKGSILDWKPLYRELFRWRFPDTTLPISIALGTKSMDHLVKMSTFARQFFPHSIMPALLEEVLPYYNPTKTRQAVACVSTIGNLLPSLQYAPEEYILEHKPDYWLPTMFYIWNLCPNSADMDKEMLKLLAKVSSAYLPFTTLGTFGLYTSSQWQQIMTAVFRSLKIPVGTSSGHRGTSSHGKGKENAERECKYVAAILICSLSSRTSTIGTEDDVLGSLAKLFQATINYMHPSNSGAWTTALAKFIYHLAKDFQVRWNRERINPLVTYDDPGTALTEAVRRRFVIVVRKIALIGMHSKRGTAHVHSAMGLLASMEPDLILPGILKGVYPSLTGLLETHRTSESLSVLSHISEALCSSKRYRSHTFGLIGLMLPAIDANDMPKTVSALRFMANIAFRVPLYDLSGDDGTDVAIQWTQAEMERLEQWTDDDLESPQDLAQSDLDEVARLSTGGLPDFVSAFFDRLLIQAEYMPDMSAQIPQASDKEEDEMELLQLFLRRFITALGPAEVKIVIQKTSNYLEHDLKYPARFILAYICAALSEINPALTMSSLLPVIESNIRFEINENNAGAKRTIITEVRTQDHALDANLYILSHLLVRTGGSVMSNYLLQLRNIVVTVIDKVMAVSGSIQGSLVLENILKSMLDIYTQDARLFEEDEASIDHWGQYPDPRTMKIKWHLPSTSEINDAWQLCSLIHDKLQDGVSLLIESKNVKDEKITNGFKASMSTSTALADDLANKVGWLGSLIAGMASFFAPHQLDSHAMNSDPETARTAFIQTKYAAGQAEMLSDPHYYDMVNLRERIGHTLHVVYNFSKSKLGTDSKGLLNIVDTMSGWLTDYHHRHTTSELNLKTRAYTLERRLFPKYGFRKRYPRILLVKRASIYHLERRCYNARFLRFSESGQILATDIMDACINQHPHVRITAQEALDALTAIYYPTCKMAAPLFLDHILCSEEHVKKGALFTLETRHLNSYITKRYELSNLFMRRILELEATTDKRSLHKLCEASAMLLLAKLAGRPYKSYANLHSLNLESLCPAADNLIGLDAEKKRRKDEIAKAAAIRLEMRLFLCDGLVRTTLHWKIEKLYLSFLAVLIEPVDIPDNEVIEVVAQRCKSEHPEIRNTAIASLFMLGTTLSRRGISGLDFGSLHEPRICGPTSTTVASESPDGSFTCQFINEYRAMQGKLFFDSVETGWLVWGRQVRANKESTHDWGDTFDTDTLQSTRTLSQFFDRNAFTLLFRYAKMETKDGTHAAYRVHVVHMLWMIFRWLQISQSTSLSEALDEAEKMFGSGDDKHEHRALSEIMTALANTIRFCNQHVQTQLLEWILRMFKVVVEGKLKQDMLPYWVNFVGMLSMNNDQKRFKDLHIYLDKLKIDRASDSAFQDTAQLSLLSQHYHNTGWPLQASDHKKTELVDLIDHPYESVRRAIASQLTVLFAQDGHPSYPTVRDLLYSKYQTEVATLHPDNSLENSIKTSFRQLSEFRKLEAVDGNYSTSYKNAAKTVCLWLRTALPSTSGLQYMSFTANPILPQCLEMIDIKEDPSLVAEAGSLAGILTGDYIPYPARHINPMISQIEKICTQSTAWRHRYTVLGILQIFFYRHLFIFSRDDIERLTAVVVLLLADERSDVRTGASNTLTGFIQCSGTPGQITKLAEKFQAQLKEAPRSRSKLPSSEREAIPSTVSPTPTHKRHSAVLGLCSLIRAFPYGRPPRWMPTIIAFLSREASGDPGIIGTTVRDTLGAFKKTRTDTWRYDQTMFNEDELELLEGSGPSYLA